MSTFLEQFTKVCGPSCYVDLMKRCWDTDPSKRPTADAIRRIVLPWYNGFPQNTNTNETFPADNMSFVIADEYQKNNPRPKTSQHSGAVYSRSMIECTNSGVVTSDELLLSGVVTNDELLLKISPADFQE